MKHFKDASLMSSDRRRKRRKSRRTKQRSTTSVLPATVVVDMCNRMLTCASASSFATLLRTLESFQLAYSRFPESYALSHRSVRLHTEEDLRFVLLLLPDGDALYDALPPCRVPASTSSLSTGPSVVTTTRYIPVASPRPPSRPSSTASGPLFDEDEIVRRINGQTDRRKAVTQTTEIGHHYTGTIVVRRSSV